MSNADLPCLSSCACRSSPSSAPGSWLPPLYPRIRLPRPSVNTGHFRVLSTAGCCGVFLAATALRWGFATMTLRLSPYPAIGDFLPSLYSPWLGERCRLKILCTTVIHCHWALTLFLQHLLNRLMPIISVILANTGSTRAESPAVDRLAFVGIDFLLHAFDHAGFSFWCVSQQTLSWRGVRWSGFFRHLDFNGHAGQSFSYAWNCMNR